MAELSAKHRVLIVEDEFLVRLTLAEALEDEGYEVVEAANGDDALAALRADPAIILLVTDIQLPGSLNGLTLARAARERRPELPAIFVTGRPDTLTGALATARDAFIVKPYLPSEIAATVRRLTDEGA